MYRTLTSKVLAVAIPVMMIVAGTEHADAGWGRHHGSWGGSSGSHGGSWGSHGSYGGSWGSHGSWGSNGGVMYSHYYGGGRPHYWGTGHRHVSPSYYSNGGYWGSSASVYGGYYGGGWASSGGSSGGCSGGTVTYHHASPVIQAAPMIQSAPVVPSSPAPMQSVPMIDDGAPTLPHDLQPAPQDNTLPLTPNAAARRETQRTAILAVQVPNDARVFVNGAKTSSTGNHRRYVSRGLHPGHDYTYEVRVEANRNGQTVTQTKKVDLRAGHSKSLAFDFAPNEGLATSLTVKVPADARVVLAGHPTKSTGSVRTFTTKGLEAGKVWSGYKVRVSVNRDGRVIADEKTIDLQGGQNTVLEFNLDSPQLADAR